MRTNGNPKAWTCPNLSLPGDQNALIEKVAAANPRTIVVLETGTAVTMPWLDKVAGVVEAWYAGSSGHKALANVLVGHVNPSGKLAITFPKSVQDLSHPVIPPLPPHDRGQGSAAVNAGTTASNYSVHYDEGAEVGYKWFEAQHKQPLFPFGFGLSYTTYAYSGLMSILPRKRRASPSRTPASARALKIAEVYAKLPNDSDESWMRLAGWTRVTLAPGESKTVTVPVDLRVLETFNEAANNWNLAPGDYPVTVGPSSEEAPLVGTLQLGSGH